MSHPPGLRRPAAAARRVTAIYRASGGMTYKQAAHKIALRKARDAVEVRHVYDRATMRSVFRSIQRKLAGRWDGKPV